MRGIRAQSLRASRHHAENLLLSHITRWLPISASAARSPQRVAELTGTGLSLGTPPYESRAGGPVIANWTAGATVQLGCVIYEMLVG